MGKPQLSAEKLFQIKVSLNDSPLPIWRRLQIPCDARLDVVHVILQISLGWNNSHLHEFESLQKTRYGQIEFGEDDPEMLDERGFHLSSLLEEEGETALYRYDFGDCWEHDLLLEKVVISEPGSMIFSRCLGGKRACPPEDVGGTDGYERFLSIIEDPENEERKEFLKWIGSEFDPDSFDARLVNTQFRVIEQDMMEIAEQLDSAKLGTKKKKK